MKRLLLIGISALIGTIVWWLVYFEQKGDTQNHENGPDASPATERFESPMLDSDFSKAFGSGNRSGENAVTYQSPESILDALALLFDRPDAKPISNDAITPLIQELLQHPDSDRVAGAIREALYQRSDIQTGQVFMLNRDGSVLSWPSYKAILLHVLTQLDVALAGEYALDSLQRKESSDLAALAVRAIALSEGNSDRLGAVLKDAIEYQPWMDEGNPAYLTAFDGVVYGLYFDLVPKLVSVLQQHDSGATHHAAYLTLKRLSQADPSQAVQALVSSGSATLLSSSQRAELFSLLDPSSSLAVGMIAQYLSTEQMSESELRQFVGYYPNMDTVFTRNILSENQFPNMSDQAQKLLAAEQSLEFFAQSNAFQNHPEQLDMLRSKLSELIESARRGGLL